MYIEHILYYMYIMMYNPFVLLAYVHILLTMYIFRLSFRTVISSFKHIAWFKHAPTVATSFLTCVHVSMCTCIMMCICIRMPAYVHLCVVHHYMYVYKIDTINN